MSLSGSTNFTMTAGNIVTRALKNCGIGLNGETPTAQETNDALEDLNILMKAYSPKGLKTYLQYTISVTLVASTKNYSIGPTGDVVADRPVEITQAFRRNSDNVDTEVNLVSKQEYFQLSDKDSSGPPIQIYYDYKLTNSEINIWPVPTTADASEYTLELIARKSADDADATTDDIEFPQEWYRALIWNLTEEVMESYDLPDSKQRRIKAKAKNTLKDAEGMDKGSNTSVYFQPTRRI